MTVPSILLLAPALLLAVRLAVSAAWIPQPLSTTIAPPSFFFAGCSGGVAVVYHRWLGPLPAFSADVGDGVNDRGPLAPDDGVDTDELSDDELAAAAGDWDEKIARYNTVHLTGRVGGDPEPRYFDDGKVVVNLSLASRRKYHGMERKLRNIASGEEETDWYGLEIWVSSFVCLLACWCGWIVCVRVCTDISHQAGVRAREYSSNAF